MHIEDAIDVFESFAYAANALLMCASAQPKLAPKPSFHDPDHGISRISFQWSTGHNLPDGRLFRRLAGGKLEELGT